MELIDQHSKKIMEGCKERALNAGLNFKDETLEYLVTNRDLLELSPKMMIPTLYDYWVQDVEVLKEKGRYDLYPTNPFETVINTRPAISFYNDNNPDWLNVMIFYHVLAHIDFFHNNNYFQHTWDYDFNGEALADKRLIARLRSEKGRWVDYIIEFTRGIDNLVDYYKELSNQDQIWKTNEERKLDFYFDLFLQQTKEINVQEYLKEIERYNELVKKLGHYEEHEFFAKVKKQHPEFEEAYNKHVQQNKTNNKQDLIQFIMEHSIFLNKYENKWMKSVMEVIRKTSIFFQPQIRTKIMNEGWATYWHERLFLEDDRIKGHEVDFSRINSQVAALSRLGLNPYALGLRLFQEIEKIANKGKLSFAFELIQDIAKRKDYNKQHNNGHNVIFDVRKDFCDFMFINKFVTQDFVDKYKLFVTGKRLNKTKRVWEYFIKSRKAENYRKMLLKSLYHPPYVSFSAGDDGILYLIHHFEGKPLVKEYISNTMMGIEYLWGAPVQLETSEISSINRSSKDKEATPEIKWRKVLYTMKDRKLSKQSL